MTNSNNTITINGRTNFNNFVASNGLNIMTSKEGKLYNVKSYHEGKMNKSILLAKLVSKEIAEDIVNKTLAENADKNSDNADTLAQVQLSQVIEQLKLLSTEELVNVYIDYAEQNSYERIYNLDESTINELYSNPWQALYDSNHKGFNDRDYFFTYNGNGHMVSFSNEDDDNCPIDIEELAQWIVDNELFNDYDIEVTTLDDMLASVEDNITDDENMLNKLIIYSNIELECYQFSINNGYTCYNDYSISEVRIYLNDLDYNQLNDIIIHLGIAYE